MIKFSEGTVIDCYPNKNDPQLQSLSYALQNAMRMIGKKKDMSMVYAWIDSLPENILDVLAIELRSMYYDQTLLIEQKRGIIKNTLAWYRKAGTPAAVQELVRVIFGEGQVVEWFDFDPVEGEIVPGMFDIITNAQLNGDMLEQFRTIIHKVKNARSHLRRVVVYRKSSVNLYISVVHTKRIRFEIRDNGMEVDTDA